MKVGFYIDAKIGDSVVALPAMRAIKQINISNKLYIFTNKIGCNLYAPLSWIDGVFYYENPDQISNFNLDFLISSNSDQNTLSNLKKSNAKKLITYLKLYHLFDFRIKSTFISSRCKPQHQKQNLLDLVNLISPLPIKLQEIKEHKLQTLPHHKEKIKTFLSPCQKPKIMINPFGFATKENLTLEEYETIAQALIKDYCLILPTFENRTSLIRQTFSHVLLSHCNFFLFENDSDLLNLIELISQIDLLISPSTGNIHIADNLGIPSIALFSHKDTILWGGEMMHYIKLDRLTPTQAIQQTLKLTQDLLCSSNI